MKLLFWSTKDSIVDKTVLAGREKIVGKEQRNNGADYNWNWCPWYDSASTKWTCMLCVNLKLCG